VPEGKDYWGRKLGHERAIRKSAGIVCTTAYAISHTGAAKLLMRSAVDLDNPVDLLIRRLTLSRDLVAYSVIPPVIAQWEYRNDVGMGERGAQSDINGGKHKDTPADAKMEGWDKVAKTGSVWITKAHHKDVVFDKMALDVAWEQIMGDAVLSDSWHDPQTGD
jgi:GR25 family glycosyltransferase involved in LPS biosynthesis